MKDVPMQETVTLTTLFECKVTKKVLLPFLEDRIPAGFPSPAEQYVSNSLDLNDFLIDHPAATFFVRITGDSMINAGLLSGDLVIVDRSISVTHNKIVIARINNELTIKRICFEGDKIILRPENAAYKPITITPEMDFEVWGVITYAIHKIT